MTGESSQIVALLLKCVLVVISLYFITTRIIRYRKNERGQTFFKLIVTLVLWGSILIITVTPPLARTISQTFGFGENLNTLIFIGFVLSFALNFRLLRSIEAIESNISDMVSKIAANNVEKIGEEKKQKPSSDL